MLSLNGLVRVDEFGHEFSFLELESVGIVFHLAF